ncbi:hypothetical protein ACR77J_07215 [Tissierella praeacuta]|uniref:hypothetical protein n=1 Tax=Tissierella praeacuta TaxID=43131 RepID=UPI003DA39F6D
MNKKIPLGDVFDRYCEHTQCKYNYNCECDYGDTVSEYMYYIKGDDFATCVGFEVKEGYCEECGSKLKKYVDKVECWGAVTDMETFSCPNCD